MGFFLVNKGTVAAVIRPGKTPSKDNIVFHATKKNNIFDKAELISDPTGIQGVPSEFWDTIVENFRCNGYYGFKKDGWLLFFHHEDVAYG
jgi:hypothetical protein